MKRSQKKIADIVEDNYDDYDVELQFGGQPVYQLIFAVE